MTDAAGGLIAVLLVPACLVLAFGGIGGAVLILGLRARQKAQASQSWPTAPGTVKSATVESRRHTRRDRRGHHHTSYSYVPDVEYEYAVMGQAYMGKRVSFGTNSYSSQAQAQAVLNRYVPGAPVTVHYDPNNPQEATLETSAAATNVSIIVGGVFVGLAVMICCLSIPIAFVFGSGLMSGF